MPHRLDETSRCPSRIGSRVVELRPLEVSRDKEVRARTCRRGGSGKVNELSCRVACTSLCHLVDGLDEVRVDALAYDHLHHSQMLEIIVRLEEGIAGKELDQDTSNAPNVARERPTEAKNDLGGPVMSG